MCLAVAPFYGPINAVTLSSSALPALAFWVLPVLFARTRRIVDDEHAVRARFAPRTRAEPRFAVSDDAPLDDEAPDTEALLDRIPNEDPTEVGVREPGRAAGDHGC